MKMNKEQIRQLNTTIANDNLDLNQDKKINENVNASFTNLDGGQDNSTVQKNFPNSTDEQLKKAPDQTYII